MIRAQIVERKDSNFNEERTSIEKSFNNNKNKASERKRETLSASLRSKRSIKPITTNDYDERPFNKEVQMIVDSSKSQRRFHSKFQTPRIGKPPINMAGVLHNEVNFNIRKTSKKGGINYNSSQIANLRKTEKEIKEVEKQIRNLNLIGAYKKSMLEGGSTPLFQSTNNYFFNYIPIKKKRKLSKKLKKP